MTRKTVKIEKSDWEVTVQGYIARILFLDDPPEYLDSPHCGFCGVLIREIKIPKAAFDRGMEECHACSGYAVCAPKDSLFDRFTNSNNRTDKRQYALAIFEWLYDYGKARGWTE